ncbi:hypothetical protein BGZ68_000734 [Mortierella alpina]|nr:hypothetical protein BGZ68_000734 [Mortierella alpina]
MNSTQYGYHPYPSPSQTQTQTQQQQQMLSPQQQQQQLQSEQQQQLSPQLSPASSHHQSPEQQHTHQLSVDHGQTAMNGSSNAGNGHEVNNTTSSNSGSHIEQHSPGHSNDVQSPVDAEGELIVPTPGGPGQTSQQQPSSGVASGTLHSPVSGQGHPTTLLPMPSPALAAATAANTAANTNSSASRQAILQQYQQQQQHQQQQQQQQQQHLGMGMSLSMQPTSANGNPGAINTAMMSLQGSSSYMLPSPQSAGSGQPSLPALPPQSTDLDTILAKYANQPDLLKLIIASKTEEDRRWAEEARYRMMDLIMRGENRGLGFMAGYEALGGIPGNMPGAIMGMTAKRFMEEGGYGHHPGFAGFPPSGQPGLGGAAAAPGTEGVAEAHSSGGGPGSAGVVSSLNPASTAGSTSAGGMPSMYAPTQMLGMGGMGGMAGMGHPSQQMMIQGMGVAPGGGFSQYIDPSLARKRSVTFAGEVHHMRSQSLSSIPSPGAVGQLGNMPMMGMGVGGTDAFGQHHQQQAHQQSQTSALQGASQYQFQQQHQQQQQQHQQQQQQQPMQYHHHAAQPPLPPFAGGGNPYAHQSFTPHPSLHHHSVIRRTNSLSHISHTQTTVTEQRLVAGRPRNDSSASIRNMDDDSDEDSDEDYDNHPVMGMSSRPGSALSMHNNMGGNGETSLTLEFSDMASVSGGGHHHHHHDGPNSVNSSMAVSGPGGVVSGATGSTTTTTTTSTKTTKSHRSTPSTSSLSGMTGDAGSEGADYKRKRKRREMQPVNKIVESPEPHVDPYLWKNNGNTTQKKTGCKSIYYKCSNSPAGCTVNKTVTEKEGGGYITKYRGEHLEDCIRLKKAQLAAQAAQAAAQNGHHSIQKEQ